MADKDSPGAGDAGRLHPHIKRDDSGFFSPCSGGTTPVPTPQPIQEEKDEQASGGMEPARTPIERRHSLSDITSPSPHPPPEPNRATMVQLEHSLQESTDGPPVTLPPMRNPAAAMETMRMRSSSTGNLFSRQQMYLASSYHFHRDQLTRAGIGPLPVNLVTNVNTRAEEIVSRLEQEEPFDLDHPPSLPMGPLASQLPPGQIPIPPTILSTIPEQPNTPSSPGSESDKILSRGEGSVKEVTYPHQEVLCDFDRNHLTPGRDRYYFEDRDYNLQQHLGEGGFGTCVCGLDFVTQSTFAMKRNNRSDDDKIKSISTECHMMERLGCHDNVTQFFGAIIDYYNDNQQDYQCQKVCKMIMELAENGNLYEMLVVDGEPTALPCDQSLYYLQQILQGVDYLHTNSIVHLDIKAANVLVFNEGRTVKLADFGSALHVGDIPPVASLKGRSPHWSAPEVIQEHQPTFSADIWSVMCVLVEMLTAKLPGCFQFQRDQTAMIFMIGRYTDDQIEQLIPYKELQLDEGVVDLFVRVFKRNSRERPTAWDLLQHPCIIDAYEYEKFFDLDYEEEEEEEGEGEEEEEEEESFHTAPTSQLPGDISGKRASEDSGIGSLRVGIHRSSTGGSSYCSTLSRGLSDASIDMSDMDLTTRNKLKKQESIREEEEPPMSYSTHPETSFSVLHLRRQRDNEDFHSLPVYAATPLSDQIHYLSLEAKTKQRRRPNSINTLKHSNSMSEAEERGGASGSGRRRYLRRMSLGEKGRSWTDSDMEIDGVMHKSNLRRTSSEKYVDRGPEIDTPEKDKKPHSLFTSHAYDNQIHPSPLPPHPSTTLPSHPIPPGAAAKYTCQCYHGNKTAMEHTCIKALCN